MRPLRAKLARWGLLVAAAVGLFWLGPRAQGRTLAVDLELRNPTCVEHVELHLSRDRALARSVRLTLGAEPRARWEAKLPADLYRLRVGLECRSGALVEALQRPVDVADGDLALPVTVTASCACAS